jgi:type IV secretion system protein VirB1
MMVAAITLAQLLNQCAPNVGRRTMTAIVRVESGGNPLLIHDNSIDRTFSPHDANQGVVWANQLLGLGHSIDLGISQINSVNLPKLGLSVREAFDPCSNVHGGATILASDYRAAASQFGQGQYALRRAIGAYNSGSLFAGYGYIAKILAAVGISAGDDFHVPELQSVVFPAPNLHGAAPRTIVRLAPTVRASAPDPYSAPILIVTATPTPRPSPTATAANSASPAATKPSPSAPSSSASPRPATSAAIAPATSAPVGSASPR